MFKSMFGEFAEVLAILCLIGLVSAILAFNKGQDDAGSLAVNKKLSEAFTDEYMGRPFWATNASCAADVDSMGIKGSALIWDVSVSEVESGPAITTAGKGEFGDQAYGCLVKPDSRAWFSIRQGDQGAGYVVSTSGEERDALFTPDITLRLI